MEGIESLNDLGAGLYGEFERFDCFDVMTCMSDGAMIRGAKRSCCRAERSIESSDEPKIGRYGFDLLNPRGSVLQCPEDL